MSSRLPPIDSFSGEFRFLSNFYPSPVTFDGLRYPSVENAYQASKTLDRVQRQAFVNVSPGEAKRLGQALPLRKDWEQVKLKIMEILLLKKFTPGTDLAFQLLGTGNRQLIEGNHWGDRFWGMCGGRGENHLGLLLMEIRDKLYKLNGR
jgi:ribA/ribD-fused uncharacterized protein